MALTKRVELLLDPDEYAELAEIARRRKESIGALIRRALEREYLQPTREQKRAALRQLLSQDIDFGSWERAKKDISREIVKEIEASRH
ncbi:MAG: ribbon-helix-helix protein, CopG family [Chloroflexi bacterium]|nr:ribbon-helix-helix protein, CopG family [Chloroflexota bacterium]